MPPKTTLQNYNYIPHLEQLLLWFLQNDAQIKILSTPAIRQLFNEGYRPTSTKENDPSILEEAMRNNNQSAEIHILERWLVIRIWLDLIAAKTEAEKTNKDLDQSIKLCIDLLDKYGNKTLISAGTIMHKYDLDPVVKDLEEELVKISTHEEKEIFKQDYLADTLTAAEIRILAWIYKELFDKEYKILQKN